MKGYVIVDVEVTDPQTYAEYTRIVGPTIEQYGGTFLVRGSKAQVLEGEWQPHRAVILEFESVDRALEWYHSEAYRVPLEMRKRSSNSTLIVVEGA